MEAVARSIPPSSCAFAVECPVLTYIHAEPQARIRSLLTAGDLSVRPSTVIYCHRYAGFWLQRALCDAECSHDTSRNILP